VYSCDVLDCSRISSILISRISLKYSLFSSDISESCCTINSSSKTPSIALKLQVFFRYPGQTYLKRGFPFVQRLDSGITLSRFPQQGQCTIPANRAFVFRCGRLYFSAMASRSSCVSIQRSLEMKPSCLPTAIIHSLIGLFSIVCTNFGEMKVLPLSSYFS